MRIVEDYYTVNASAITIDMMNFELPFSCFDVMPEEVFEFWLNATTDGAGDAMNDVVEINLIDATAGTTVLAQATYTADTLMLTRNWSLFYKGKNASDSDPNDYSIQLVTNGGTAGTIAINNLMWGFRTFSSTYPLTDTAPTC